MCTPASRNRFARLVGKKSVIIEFAHVLFILTSISWCYLIINVPYCGVRVANCMAVAGLELCELSRSWELLPSAIMVILHISLFVLMLYGYLPSGSINECVSPPNVNWKVASWLCGDVNATSTSGQGRAVAKIIINENFYKWWRCADERSKVSR